MKPLIIYTWSSTSAVFKLINCGKCSVDVRLRKLDHSRSLQFRELQITEDKRHKRLSFNLSEIVAD